MAPHTYGEILARNMRAARSRIGIGQANVAARMQALGFTQWVPQTVSKSERNDRRLLAEEIFALAWALEVSIAQLLEPSPSDGMVEFPVRAALAAKSVSDSVRGSYDGSVTWKGDSPVFVAASWPSADYEAWRAARGGEH